jgi:TPR repeat protein
MKQPLLALALAGVLLLPACSAETRVATIRERAEHGNARAEALMGEMYATGADVPRDDALAAKWYAKAAAAGLAQAQYNLGVLYERGQGLPKSDAQAASWYEKAAAHGLAAAQYNMGVFYEQGRGVHKDENAAAKWYQRAGAQGQTDAQYNLGALYAQRNKPAEAYFWFGLAAKSGDAEAARMRDKAGARLPAAEATAIERRVRAWRPVIVTG